MIINSYYLPVIEHKFSGVELKSSPKTKKSIQLT